MQRSLSGSIALTKIKHHMLSLKGKSGNTVKGIFIPVGPENPNHLVPGKDDSYYMPVRVIVRDDADKYGQHGFISQAVSSDTYKKGTEQQREEFSKLPILGNIKDFERAENDGNMGNASLSQESIEVEEGSDLPF